MSYYQPIQADKQALAEATRDAAQPVEESALSGLSTGIAKGGMAFRQLQMAEEKSEAEELLIKKGVAGLQDAFNSIGFDKIEASSFRGDIMEGYKLYMEQVNSHKEKESKVKSSKAVSAIIGRGRFRGEEKEVTQMHGNIDLAVMGIQPLSEQFQTTTKVGTKKRITYQDALEEHIAQGGSLDDLKTSDQKMLKDYFAIQEEGELDKEMTIEEAKRQTAVLALEESEANRKLEASSNMPPMKSKGYDKFDKKLTELNAKSSKLDEASSGFQVLLKGLQHGQKTGVLDIATVFAFMKQLDPVSVVRESEFEQAAKATGYTDYITGFTDKLISGKFLTKQGLHEFVDFMVAAHNWRAERVKSEVDKAVGGSVQRWYRNAEGAKEKAEKVVKASILDVNTISYDQIQALHRALATDEGRELLKGMNDTIDKKHKTWAVRKPISKEDEQRGQ